MSARHPDLWTALGTKRPGRLARAVRVSLAALLSIVAAISPARAQPSPASDAGARPEGSVEDSVRDLMRRGLDEFSRGNHQAAHAAFEQAWKLRKHTAIALALATAELKLSRYRDAAEHLQYYLDHLPAEQAAQRADAKAKLDECKRHVGSVAVTVDAADARIVVDDAVVGSAPLRVWLEPGTHTVWAKHENRTTDTQVVKLAAGEDKTLALVLPPATPTPPTDAGTSSNAAATRHLEPGAASASPGWSTGRSATVVGGTALTAISLGVGIGFTLKANAASDEAARIREETRQQGDPNLLDERSVCSSDAAAQPAGCAALREKVQEAHDAETVAIVTYVAAGVLATGTLAAVLFWPEDGRGTGDRGVAVAPWLSHETQGVQLRGQF